MASMGEARHGMPRRVASASSTARGCSVPHCTPAQLRHTLLGCAASDNLPITRSAVRREEDCRQGGAAGQSLQGPYGRWDGVRSTPLTPAIRALGMCSLASHWGTRLVLHSCVLVTLVSASFHTVLVVIVIVIVDQEAHSKHETLNARDNMKTRQYPHSRGRS